jgi:hypothetical protein
MAINFPSSPVLNQTFSAEGISYIYNGKQWVGAAGGGSQTLNDTLGIGNTSSLGMSVGISTFNNSVIVGGATTALLVLGDTRIVGILTIGAASITFDGNDKKIIIGEGITLTGAGGANYVGIITASGFVGDGSLLTNLPGGSGIATVARTLVSNEASISTGVTTTATSSETPIDTFSTSTYRCAKYLVQITKGTSYHTTEIVVVHDGTTTYNTEYGIIKTNELLSTFDTDINSGNVRLLATPTSSSSTTFKIVRTLINS